MALALVLRALGLGDLLTGVPALRGVRAALPDHELVLVAPAWQEPLVALTGAVDRVVHHDGVRALLPLTWTGPPPDVAVNLHGAGPESHRLLLATRPHRLVAFGNDSVPWSGPPWTPGPSPEHEVARWCRLVATDLGPADPGDLVLTRPGVHSVAPGAVVMHPGAAYASRRWPAERFGAVARSLRALGRRVVITGSAAERELAVSVARSAGVPADDVLAGSTEVLELAAVVAGAACLVSGDTGIAHLASAFGTPSVVMFGPVSPAVWGPPPRPRHVVLWHGDGTGDPWGQTCDPALLRIGVPEVLAAVDRVLTVPRQAEPRRTSSVLR